MKRTLVPLLASLLLAAPVVASAEIVVRNLDVSIGIGSRPHRYEPQREVVYVDRRPEVVHIHEDRDRDRDRWERKHHRRHHRDEWRDRRRWRDEPKVVVIDRDRGHRCDDRKKVVIVADDRRW